MEKISNNFNTLKRPIKDIKIKKASSDKTKKNKDKRKFIGILNIFEKLKKHIKIVFNEKLEDAKNAEEIRSAQYELTIFSLNEE